MNQEMQDLKKSLSFFARRMRLMASLTSMGLAAFLRRYSSSSSASRRMSLGLLTSAISSLLRATLNLLFISLSSMPLSSGSCWIYSMLASPCNLTGPAGAQTASRHDFQHFFMLQQEVL